MTTWTLLLFLLNGSVVQVTDFPSLKWCEEARATIQGEMLGTVKGVCLKLPSPVKAPE